MGAAATERAMTRGRNAHLSHAVDMDTRRPLCKRVNISSLVDDSSTWSNELPECPECQRMLKNLIQ